MANQQIKDSNFWDLVQLAGHPNYCELCARVGGSCGGLGCAGQFWQIDWDLVQIGTNPDGSQWVDDAGLQLKLPIHKYHATVSCDCYTDTGIFDCGDHLTEKAAEDEIQKFIKENCTHLYWWKITKGEETVKRFYIATGISTSKPEWKTGKSC